MKLNKVSITIIIAGMIIIAVVIIFFHQIKQVTTHMITKNYFTIDELCASSTAKRKGIDNTPPPQVVANLTQLRDKVLNPLREQYGAAIWVHSGYRCPELNAAVGGVANSQHIVGEAADIDTYSRDNNRKLFEILIAQANFDQIIWEGDGDWIHVSYKANGYNRGAILAQNPNGGYTNIQSNWQTAIG